MHLVDVILQRLHPRFSGQLAQCVLGLIGGQTQGERFQGIDPNGLHVVRQAVMANTLDIRCGSGILHILDIRFGSGILHILDIRCGSGIL